MPLLACLILFQTGKAPDMATLSRLAQSRNASALSQYIAAQPPEGKVAIQVVRTNGAYDVGRYGWKAAEMVSPDKAAKYVVFTTPLTSEDIGELVFQRQADGKLKFIREENDLGVRVARNDLNLKFSLPDRKVTIRAVTDFKVTGNGPGHFLIRMSPTYRVRSITNKGVRVPFVQAGGVVAIARPKTGSGFSYALYYDGIVTTKGYAGSVNPGEAQLTNDYWYPMIARQPAPYTMTAAAPKGWTVVGQGDLVSKKPQGTDTIFRYKMDLPVVYYSVSVGPYKSEEMNTGGRKFTTYSTHLTAQEMRDQNTFYSSIVDFYSRTFAPFPFPGYGALSTDLYQGGALEAYSYATWSRGVLPEEDAHEPSHTYWGGWINNTYLSSFWNESFANYSEGLFDRENGRGNTEERRLAFIPDMNPSPGYKVAPVFSGGVNVGPVAGGLGYGKVSQVLYMLEELMGREALVRAMRLWLEETPKGSVGDWPQFIKVCLANPGARSPEELTKFFDHWLKRSGWAEFDIQDVRWENGILHGRVTFTSVPYLFPLDVMMERPDGTRNWAQVVVDGEAISIPCPVKPALVSFDPWLKLLRDIAPDEQPISIGSTMGSMRRYDDSRQTYLRKLGQGTLKELPFDLNGVFLVGSPETLAPMKALCDKVGFDVRFNKLTYKGTKIDLKENGALAVVDLPGGGHCMIGLGNCRVEPNLGRARVALFDVLGRFLRGDTQPKRSGRLTVKL